MPKPVAMDSKGSSISIRLDGMTEIYTMFFRQRSCVASPARRAELVGGIAPTTQNYRRKKTNDVKTSVSDEYEPGPLVETRLAPKRRSALRSFSRQRVRSRSHRQPSVLVHPPCVRKNAVPGRTGRTARRPSENELRLSRAADRAATQATKKTLNGKGRAARSARTAV